MFIFLKVTALANKGFSSTVKPFEQWTKETYGQNNNSSKAFYLDCALLYN